MGYAAAGAGRACLGGSADTVTLSAPPLSAHEVRHTGCRIISRNWQSRLSLTRCSVVC